MKVTSLGQAGFLIRSEEKTLYFTGDTLFNDDLFSTLPERIDAVFLPVNGAGNNMNFEDAALFCSLCGAGRVFPCHLGILDDRELSEFPFEGKEVQLPFCSTEI